MDRGLNILDPTSSDNTIYTTSRRLTAPIIDALKRTTDFGIDGYHAGYQSLQEEIPKEKAATHDCFFNKTLPSLTPDQQQAVNRAKDKKISTWLTVVPVTKHHFDLSAQEFRDSLALRYRKPLQTIPSTCDGCSDLFDLSHALSCRRGGLVTQRHNEVRDAFGDLSSLAWNQVIKEPVVRESSALFDSPALVADLSVRGVWVLQAEALFDIRVIDTDAQSYRAQSPIDVLSVAEREKKKKYQEACSD